MILFSNHMNFEHLNLRRLNEVGEVKPVREWTDIIVLKDRGYKYFVDKFLFFTHEIFFIKKLERMPLEFRKPLQMSPKVKVGDWYLYKDYIIIMIYGVEVQPYIFLVYLLPHIFALEHV